MVMSNDMKVLPCILTILCLAGISAAPVLQTKYDDLNELVKKIRDGFDKAAEKSESLRDEKIEGLNQNYLKQLEELQRFYNDGGNSIAALKTRDEVKRISGNAELESIQLDGEGLERLQKSRNLYSDTREKIEDSHDSELKRLVGLGNDVLNRHSRKLIRQGDLDRVDALSKVIHSWHGRPGLISEHKPPTKKTNELTEAYMIGTEWEYERRNGDLRMLKFIKGEFRIFTKKKNEREYEPDGSERWKVLDTKKRQLEGFSADLIMTLNKDLTEMTWWGKSVTAKIVEKGKE